MQLIRPENPVTLNEKHLLMKLHDLHTLFFEECKVTDGLINCLKSTLRKVLNPESADATTIKLSEDIRFEARHAVLTSEERPYTLKGRKPFGEFKCEFFNAIDPC